MSRGRVGRYIGVGVVHVFWLGRVAGSAFGGFVWFEGVVGRHFHAS